MWAQTTRGASCSLPAQGDSVLQPCLPDNPGKYEACKSICKHSLFQCLLPSKSTSLKLSRRARARSASQRGCGLETGFPGVSQPLLPPESPHPPHPEPHGLQARSGLTPQHHRGYCFLVRMDHPVRGNGEPSIKGEAY